MKRKDLTIYFLTFVLVILSMLGLSLCLPGVNDVRRGGQILTDLQIFVLEWGSALTGLLCVAALGMLVRIWLTLRNYLSQNAAKAAAALVDAPRDANNAAFTADDEFVMLTLKLDRLVSEKQRLAARAAELERLLGEESQAAHTARKDVVQARESAETSRREGLLSASRTLGVAIGGIHQSSEDLRSLSQASGAGAQEQQRLIKNAVGVMDSLDDAVVQMLRRSANAVEQAQTAQNKARSGSVVVEETVSAIRTVEQKAEDLATVVRELGSQAMAVEKIMEVISDIADQTNLLALNAAIEAARAGDAGRGFAVVADEVRKLAEKTMNATREVAQRILGIQQGVTRTEQDMRETAARVDQAVELAKGSGASLHEIVDLAGGTVRHIQDIADAARHHAETSGRISGLVREVSGISEQSFSGAQGSVMAVGGLMERVVELEAMNAVFQLIGSGSIQGIVEELADNAQIRSMRRDGQEQAMREALRRHQSLELVYITDAQGRQVVSNIGRGAHGVVEDKAAVDRDWSGRPWFRQPVETRSMAVSEVYVSSATGENCITLSTPLLSESGALMGVLAADVNLGRAAAERNSAR